MADRDNRTLIYEKERDGKTVYLGRITDEKLGDSYLIAKVDSEGKILLSEKGEIMPVGLAEETEEYTRCHFRKNGKTQVIIQMKKPEEPLDLSECQILINNDSSLARKAFDDMTDLGLKQEIADYVDNIRDKNKKICLKDFLGYVNQMRGGSLDEQTTFLLYRKYLIDNDIMPVDSKGRPYDLSCMLLPVFEVDDFIDHATIDNTELAVKVIRYLDGKKGIDAVVKLNEAKTNSPTLFARVHQYLIENKVIEPSPILKTLNLTDEQLIFIAHYDKASSESGMRTPVIPYIKKFLDSRLKKEDTIETVNRLLPQMRYGTMQEQMAYYEFCSLIPDIMKAEEELPQSSREERIKLIRKAKAKEQSRSGRKSPA